MTKNKIQLRLFKFELKKNKIFSPAYQTNTKTKLTTPVSRTKSFIHEYTGYSHSAIVVVSTFPRSRFSLKSNDLSDSPSSLSLLIKLFSLIGEFLSEV